MSKQIQSIRGMNDILPLEMPFWHFLEKELREVMHGYHYQEIRLPLVEKTELFTRSIGEETDVVGKEMYSFDDRNGDNITLRPEGTAGCARAGLQHGLLHNQVQRLWYHGPMFRYERPQKGRYRQFYQIGVETFGLAGADIEAELILLSARLWQRLGIADHVILQLNSLGNDESRDRYREKLVNYFTQHYAELDEDSRRRLMSNPLRILDSKNPQMQDLLANAPNMVEYLDSESEEHFRQLCDKLDAVGLAYQINPRLVRGLDYYSHTVFEWVTDALGAQGTVCAGGRYDKLIEQLSGKLSPAAGFAMGQERLVLLLQQFVELHQISNILDIYLIGVGEEAEKKALQLSEKLRDALPHLSIQLSSGGSLKSQLKKADKSQAKLGLIIGDDEVAQNQILVKYLRESREQTRMDVDELIAFMSSID